MWQNASCSLLTVCAKQMAGIYVPRFSWSIVQFYWFILIANGNTFHAYHSDLRGMIENLLVGADQHGREIGCCTSVCWGQALYISTYKVLCPMVLFTIKSWLAVADSLFKTGSQFIHGRSNVPLFSLATKGRIKSIGDRLLMKKDHALRYKTLMKNYCT